MRSLVLIPALVSLLAACGRKDDAPREGAPSTTSSAPATSRYSLPSDPGGGIPVAKAKSDAPKDDVVVVGRVRDMLQRRAGFSLIDVSIPYCGQTEMEGCPTPWDYCCKNPAEVSAKTIQVRVRGADGRTVHVEKIPELRNLDLVVVRGKLVRDGDDVALDAVGWYRRERPDLEWDINWPP
jgi:hypothetical protein